VPTDQAAKRLKSALWLSLGRLIDAHSLLHGTNATPQFIGSLTELVYAQIQSASRDLESFAKHAGRSTVTTDDVLLLARRNDGLQTLLRQHVDELRAADGGSKKGKGRARK